MAKAHEARLLAVQRAKAEATAEMEAKIAELEAQLVDQNRDRGYPPGDDGTSCDPPGG